MTATRFYAVEYTATPDGLRRLTYYGRSESDALAQYAEHKASADCYECEVFTDCGTEHLRIRRYARQGMRVIESTVPVRYTRDEH